MVRGKTYRIETPRLVVRCYNPVDAPLLKAAVDASVEHLRHWMPWANSEPQTLDEKIDLIRGFRSRFDAGENFTMGIFDREETRLLGGTGMHPRGEAHEREIGYWVHADHEGKGLITETVSALVRVGFEIEGLEKITVLHDPANVRSGEVPRRLGFTKEAVLRKARPIGDGSLQDAVVWGLLRSELAQSPAVNLDFTAYDAAGRKLPLEND